MRFYLFDDMNISNIWQLCQLSMLKYLRCLKCQWCNYTDNKKSVQFWKNLFVTGDFILDIITEMIFTLKSITFTK